jgi:Leucine-rich repeat (LRR) protein
MIQQTVYYVAASGSLTLVDPTVAQTPGNSSSVYVFTDITSLVISSSGQIVAYSQSIETISLPISTTNIVYSEYISRNEIPDPFTASLVDPTSSAIFPLDPSPTSSYTVNLAFTETQGTSTTNGYLLLSSSLGTSGSSSVVVNSNSLNVSMGVNALTNYYVKLEGDNTYDYEANLAIYNENTNAFIFNETKYNSPITASLYFNEDNAPILPINIDGNISVYPSIIMTWNNISSSSVIPPDDLAGWNAYFSVTASSVTVTGSEVRLKGSLTPTASLDPLLTAPVYLQNMISMSLSSQELVSCSFNGLTDLEYLNLQDNYLTRVQDLTTYTNLKYINIGDNDISGSLPNLAQFSNLEYFNCQLNKITSSFIDLSSNQNLKHFNCSYNNITGSITNLENNTALEIFMCHYNNLTGELPTLETNTNLSTFIAGGNNLSGNIPISIASLPSLQYFYVQDNALTGQLPPIGGSPSLVNFYAGQNQLTGELPYLNLSIQAFSVPFNQLSGELDTINYFISRSALQYFDCSYNQLTGSVPYFYGNPLTYFDCSNNNLTFFPDYEASTQGALFPSSLTTMDFSFNQFTSSSMDRLALTLETAFSGSGISGSINVTGSEMPATSASCLIFQNLVNDGWTIYSNCVFA